VTLLRCRCGSQLAALSTRRAATVRDFVPLVNIGSFGRCRAPENPSRRDGESTAPCVPSVSRPWLPGDPRRRAGGVALLSGESATRCRWGGVIEIVATEKPRG
jgi:hypothetical protein